VAARVVFVCTANSARSQLAAASWNRISGFPATSAGTHPAARVHPRAITTGHRHGLLLGRLTNSFETTVRSDELVVAVCDTAHEELLPTGSRSHRGIADPVPADTDEAFETAYQDITFRVEQLAEAIADHAAQPSGRPATQRTRRNR